MPASAAKPIGHGFLIGRLMQQSSQAHDFSGQPAPKGPRGRNWRMLYYSAALLALFLPLCAGIWLWHYATTPLPQLNGRQIEIIIPPASDFSTIQRTLVDHGVMTDDPRFRLLARLHDTAHRLKAGEYRFVSGQTPHDILETLASGRVLYRQITIPEGANLREVAAILEKNGWAGASEFFTLTHNQNMLAQLGIEADNLEGYLFPDTYSLTRGHSPQTLINMMLVRLRQVLAELAPHRYEFSSSRASSTGHATRFSEIAPMTSHGVTLSLHQLLTLASIVEKETGLAEERTLVAGVFLNRLKAGMRLQADPTVIYGIADFSGNLRRQDLLTPSAYNTYTLKGLPKGPIANPGRDAIAAVLHFFSDNSGPPPSFGPYYYFVASNDGGHHFSKTLSEHNRAVRRYQQPRTTN